MRLTAIILLFSVTLAELRGQGREVYSNSTNIFRAVAYYVNWAIYDRKFIPQDLPADELTHVMYAFANVKPDTGEVYLSDPWVDIDIYFPSDTRNEAGTNLYGCLKQLYLLKKQNRHLKVLLSIGGWSYSSNFATTASTALGRSAFASSAVSLVKSLGLDGIDINWEYPGDDIEATNMVKLLQTVRAGLDAYGQSLNPLYRFTLTVACPAGPSNYQILHVADMDLYLDFWNFMAYDYAGNWSTVTANQANLFSSANNSASTPFDTQTGIDYYISKGVPANKIVLGMPIYGRSFNATNGLGMTFSGVGRGSWEAGVYDFKSLPLSGATEFYDKATGSSYSYDAAKGELISYDTVAVAKQKALWIRQLGLGGAMWWESSADKPGDLSLIHNVVQILGEDGSALENTWNELSYPDSTYDNLRAGMPDSNSALFCSPSPSSCSGGSHLSSGLIATNSSSSASLSSSFLCTKTSSLSPSASQLGTTTITISSTLTSTVTRCITTSSASPSSSMSQSNSSSSLPVLKSTDLSSKSPSTTFEALVFNSSMSKTSDSTESAKWNTSTSDHISPTPEIPTSIALSWAKNTTTALPYPTSQITNSTSSSTAIIASLTPLTESFISLSSASETLTSTSDGPVCTSGSTCKTYNCVACPGGGCFCGINSSGEPKCFQDGPCQRKCSAIQDCGLGEGCVVDSCCGPAGYCITIAKDPSWCANPVNRKRDHGGSWQGIWQGSTSCQAFHQM